MHPSTSSATVVGVWAIIKTNVLTDAMHTARYAEVLSTLRRCARVREEDTRELLSRRGPTTEAEAEDAGGLAPDKEAGDPPQGAEEKTLQIQRKGGSSLLTGLIMMTNQARKLMSPSEGDLSQERVAKEEEVQPEMTEEKILGEQDLGDLGGTYMII